MQFGDFLWAILMFIVGLIIFRVTSLKKFLDVVGVIVSVFSLFSATQRVAQATDRMNELLFEITVNFFSQEIDIDVHNVGITVNFGIPNIIQNHISSDDPVFVPQ